MHHLSVWLALWSSGCARPGAGRLVGGPLLLVWVVCLACGCGADGENRYGVSGRVTWRGQPLDQGTIQFFPLGEQGTFSGTVVQDGRYAIAADSGLEPGRYAVRISSPEAGEVVDEPAPGESGPLARERIPPEYNVATSLEFEVTASGQNRFDVDIP